MSSLPTSYRGFLKEVGGADALVPDLVQKMFQHVLLPLKANAYGLPVFYAVDFTRRSYVSMERECQNVIGYSAEYFLHEGLDAFIDRWPKDDFDIYNRKVFPSQLRCINSHPAEDTPLLIFSRNYGFKRRDGNIANLLQRHFFVSDSSGVVVGAIGAVTDITHFKTDHSITHVIERVSPGTGMPGQLLLKETHFPHHPLHDVTKRELEILKWLSEGKRPDEIAEKLNISYHTVRNHRKNLLRKTNCKNTSELTTIAVRTGLL